MAYTTYNRATGINSLSLPLPQLLPRLLSTVREHTHTIRTVVSIEVGNALLNNHGDLMACLASSREFVERHTKHRGNGVGWQLHRSIEIDELIKNKRAPRGEAEWEREEGGRYLGNLGVGPSKRGYTEESAQVLLLLLLVHSGVFFGGALLL